MQIAMVTGLCTAGGAYVPSMCDEAIMVDRISSLFLGGPPLVRAATGEILTAEELGGATVHCSISGVTDHFAKTEEDAVAMTRSIVSCLNLRRPSCQSSTTCIEEPHLLASDEDFAAVLETEQQMLQVSSLQHMDHVYTFHTCVCTCVCMYARPVYVHVFVCMPGMCLYMCLYVCQTCVCTCVCMYARHVYVHVFVCMPDLCMHMCLYVCQTCVCTCVCMHVRTVYVHVFVCMPDLCMYMCLYARQACIYTCVCMYARPVYVHVLVCTSGLCMYMCLYVCVYFLCIYVCLYVLLSGSCYVFLV